MLTLQAVCHDEVVPPSKLVPDYPPELERVVLRALKKRPEDRYPSAMAMRRDLRGVSQLLNGSKVPEESLSRVMRRLFAGRIEEKQLMLRKLSDGADSVELPEAEPELSIEVVAPEPLEPISVLPTSTESNQVPSLPAESTSSSQSMTTEMAWASDGNANGSISLPDNFLAEVRSERVKHRNIALAVMSLSLLVAAYGLGQGWFVSPEEPTQNIYEPSPTISVRIVTRPGGAKVELHGEVHGETPLDLELERDTGPILFNLSKEGFETVTETIIPDRDQRIQLQLSEMEGSKSSRVRPPNPSNSPSSPSSPNRPNRELK